MGSCNRGHVNPLPGSPGFRTRPPKPNNLFVNGRTLKTLAPLALVGASAAAHAQSTFNVDCRSSYILTSPYDAGMPAPTRIKLSDLKVQAGDVITITEQGKFSQSKSWPEDTDVVGAVFSRDDRFIADYTQRHRIPGAIRAGAALITPHEVSKGFFTDIAEDFAVAPTGTKVVVPSGAQYLFVAAIDSYYADNTSAKGLTVTITKSGVTPAKGRNSLYRLLPASTGLASGANAVAANGLAAGWVAKGDYSEAATFKGGSYSSANPFGGNAARAYAVDSNGNAIGSGLSKDGLDHAFLATNKGIASLSDDAGEAFAMNPSGTIVGYRNIWGGFNYPTATVNGTAQFIDTNWNQGIATAINAKGDVVGYEMGTNLKPYGFISTATKDARKAVLLPISDSYAAYPVGINDSGVVVGNYVVGNNATDKPYRQQVRGFILDKSGFRDLGMLPGGDTVEVAAINNKGQIVGSATTADGETHAFLYDGGKMVDLGTLDGTDSYATAINDNGTIVGTALDKNGLTQAFSTTATVATPVAVSALKMDTNYFAESTTATATVTLASEAPKGGQIVMITSSKAGVVTFSNTVTVEAGSTTASFPVYATATEANVPFTLTATSASKSVTFAATTRSMTLQNFRLAAYTAKANTTLAGSFSLELPAMSAGKTIKIWSDNAAVTVPATVTVAAGTQAGTFSVKIGTVAVGTKVTIYAQCGDRQSSTAITIAK